LKDTQQKEINIELIKEKQKNLMAQDNIEQHNLERVKKEIMEAK
jgi:hypothetical protein